MGKSIEGGIFYGITAYFNPVGYRSRLFNYKMFRAASQKQGLKLLTVELAFNGRPFELDRRDADILIHLRTDEKNVMWQKEALLNIALSRLPKDCAEVAWLDADIEFKDDLWISKASEALKKAKVVQLFSSVRQADKPDETGEFAGQSRHGFVCAHKNGFEQVGHAGFAWAARRKVMERVRFYDWNILGSGDTLFKDACYGTATFYLSRSLTEAAHSLQHRWASKVYRAVGNEIGYIDGTICHAWHGSIADRRYRTRQQILKEHDFDPLKDVRLDKNGALEWATDKPALHEDVAEYFRLRKED